MVLDAAQGAHEIRSRRHWALHWAHHARVRSNWSWNWPFSAKQESNYQTERFNAEAILPDGSGSNWYKIHSFPTRPNWQNHLEPLTSPSRSQQQPADLLASTVSISVKVHEDICGQKCRVNNQKYQKVTSILQHLTHPPHFQILLQNHQSHQDRPRWPLTQGSFKHHAALRRALSRLLLFRQLQIRWCLFFFWLPWRLPCCKFEKNHLEHACSIQGFLIWTSLHPVWCKPSQDTAIGFAESDNCSSTCQFGAIFNSEIPMSANRAWKVYCSSIWCFITFANSWTQGNLDRNSETWTWSLDLVWKRYAPASAEFQSWSDKACVHNFWAFQIRIMLAACLWRSKWPELLICLSSSTFADFELQTVQFFGSVNWWGNSGFLRETQNGWAAYPKFGGGVPDYA